MRGRDTDWGDVIMARRLLGGLKLQMPQSSAGPSG